MLFGIKSYIETDNNLSFNKRIIQAYKVVPKIHLFFFTLVSLFSLYALYIGANNSIFIGETISIGERYSRVPQGLITILSQKIGFPILLMVIGINITLLRRNIQSIEIKKLLRMFSLIGLFSLMMTNT